MASLILQIWQRSFFFFGGVLTASDEAEAAAGDVEAPGSGWGRWVCWVSGKAGVGLGATTGETTDELETLPCFDSSAAGFTGDGGDCTEAGAACCCFLKHLEQ